MGFSVRVVVAWVRVSGHWSLTCGGVSSEQVSSMVRALDRDRLARPLAGLRRPLAGLHLAGLRRPLAGLRRPLAGLVGLSRRVGLSRPWVVALEGALAVVALEGASAVVFGLATATLVCSLAERLAGAHLVIIP